MSRARPEPVQVVKERRDRALRLLVEGVPYTRFIGVAFDRRGDELTAIMNFDEKLIGNPFLPALHGGAIASFLEVTAIVGLSWQTLWDEIESGRIPEGSRILFLHTGGVFANFSYDEWGQVLSG